MTKIVCIADLQGMAKNILPGMLPDGDMLLVAGDLAGWGTIRELEDVNEWFGTLDYKHIIVVAGNHDQEIRDIDGHLLFTNATYLQDELIEIDGIKIYGSPANEMNELRLRRDWAFCDPQYLRKVMEDIPLGLDILLTHGPVYGILDQLAWNGVSVGSRDLLDAVKEKKPRYHVFGHIHEAHGKTRKYKTTFVNAAICDEQNTLFKDRSGRLMYEPIVINIQKRK